MAGSQDFVEDPRNTGVLALVDGTLVRASEASVSIFDAGFGLGDGVWEGLRLHRGSLLFFDAHLDRLWASADSLGIDIGKSRDELTADLVRLLSANGMSDRAHLRLMVTRGRKLSINQDPRNAIGRATIVVTAEYKARPANVIPLALRTVSIRTSGPETFDMRLNTHSRANYILALNQAIAAGGDEAVMLDPHGHVASCNATNLFWVREGVVCTSGDLYCFNGITRANIIELCRQGVAPITTSDFPIDALRSADEIFVTGTMGGVTPVGSIDGIAMQSPGSVTAKLAAAYEAMKDADAAANPLT